MPELPDDPEELTPPLLLVCPEPELDLPEEPGRPDFPDEPTTPLDNPDVLEPPAGGPLYLPPPALQLVTPCEPSEQKLTSVLGGPPSGPIPIDAVSAVAPASERSSGLEIIVTPRCRKVASP